MRRSSRSAGMRSGDEGRRFEGACAHPQRRDKDPRGETLRRQLANLFVLGAAGAAEHRHDWLAHPRARLSNLDARGVGEAQNLGA